MGDVADEKLGITPQDIVDYKLPTHPLKDMDIKRARDAIKNDPFIKHYREWIHAIEHLLKMGVRAEQQALAKHGLNYVIETYPPQKLAHPERFLP
jgi:DNA topoisomerase-6 subunit A